MFVMTTNGK
jgi:hypothetical protein